MSVKYHGRNILTRTLTAQPHEPPEGLIDLRTRFQFVEAGKLFIAIKDLLNIASHAISTLAVADRCWTNSHGVFWIQGYSIKTWCRKCNDFGSLFSATRETGDGDPTIDDFGEILIALG